MIKTKFGIEKYLSCVTNSKHRAELAKFRCSAHKLAIEEGRYRNLERKQRLCIFCNMGVVEDEYHFSLTCPFYREIRMKCLPKYYCSWPNVHKFKLLLNSENSKLLTRLGNYLYLANQKRMNAVIG